MSKLNESIINRVKSLPPLPNSVTQIQRICSDSNSGINDLVVVVEKDPMLTANLLRMANSPFYGYAGKIKTLSHALTLFGMTTVSGFVLASAVRSSFKIDLSPYGITATEFAESSQLQSALMFHWYARIDREMANILVPASFVDGVGKIIISAEVIRDGNAKEFLKELKDTEDVSEVERRFVGLSNELISADMFEHWQLDKNMVDAIRASDNIEKAPEELRPYGMALRIVRAAVRPSGLIDDESVEKALKLFEEAKIEKAPFQKAIEKTTESDTE